MATTVCTSLISLLFIAISNINGEPPKGETLAFLAKPWIPFPSVPTLRQKYVNRDDSVVINCTTNDPQATVSLSIRDSNSDPFVDALSKFGVRMQQIGQTFYIPKLVNRDTYHYECSAANDVDKEITLALGRLIVNPAIQKRIPDIFPSGTVRIESGGSQNITCSSRGIATVEKSYLTWHQKVGSNTVQVDDSRVVHEEERSSDNNFIDVIILMFTNFGESDKGSYLCRRKVGTSAPTEKAVEIEFEPNQAPRIAFPDHGATNFISRAEGVDLNIRCSVVGFPLPEKTWEKNGVLFKTCTNKKDPDCILYIPVLKHEKHSDVYSCVATNIVKTVKKDVKVEVRVPPVLIKPTEVKISNMNEDIELQCILSTGNPHPNIMWFQQLDTCDPNTAGECKPVQSNWEKVKNQFPDENIPTNLSYIIANRTESNYFYRCSAKSSAGADIYTFSLARKAQAIPQFAIEPKTETGKLTINEEDELEIQCVTQIDIYVDVYLTRDGVKLATTTQNVDGKNTRYTKHTIDSAELSDKGKYECQGILNRGGDRVDSLSVSVKKLEAPVITGFADQIISQDNMRDFVLTCNASGNPVPDITWKFNGTDLDKSLIIKNKKQCEVSTSGIYHVVNEAKKIIICKMSYEEHEGKYGCSATNKKSSVDSKMNLIIQASPKIVYPKSSSKITVSLSDTREIDCDVQANPPANVSWSRVDTITNKTTLISSRVGADVLVLGDIQKSTQGVYVCTAISKLGNTSAYVQISVMGSTGRSIKTFEKGTVIGVVIAAVVIVLIFLIFIIWYRRRLKRKYALYLEPNENFILDPDRSLFDQSSDLPYDMSWEFPRDRLILISTLGSGAFGEVWLAEAEGIDGFHPRDKSSAANKRRRSIQKQKRRYHVMSVRYRKQLNAPEVTTLEKTMVAVKTLKDGAAEDEYKDLASELKILIHLGEHKNIVNLLGACTSKGKLYVILECCPHGNLLTFLRSKRETFKPLWAKQETDMSKEFTYIDLVMIVFQVARAMDFLQSKKCVHRDLAARNVLIGEDYIVKIADFGLARDIYKNEFYLKETTGLLPVKWMAPESLFDKVYTSMSDVWSFGIVLWEAYTLGGSPYPGLPTEDLFTYLEDGKRMDCPEICPKDVYEIMSLCWRKSPYERPLFAHIVEQLGNIMKQNVQSDNEYLDFSDSAPNDDYLEPTTDNLKRAESDPQYLEATEHYTPKGQTYVPPPAPNGSSYTGDDDDISNSPLPPTPSFPSEGYVPMTPSNHYQSPTAFRYDSGKEAIV